MLAFRLNILEQPFQQCKNYSKSNKTKSKTCPLFDVFSVLFKYLFEKVDHGFLNRREGIRTPDELNVPPIMNRALLAAQRTRRSLKSSLTKNRPYRIRTDDQEIMSLLL